MTSNAGSATSATTASASSIASTTITSVDVAREAGVSQATVARTYSAPHKVSEATKAKVRDAAQRIGYVPNAIARSLKSQRTNIVGAVVPAYGEYWQSVVTEFSRCLADHDRQLLLFSFTEPEQVNTMLEAVHQYRLDGLLLASATIEYEQLSSMAATNIPLVAFNQPAAAGLVNSVTVDNEAGMTDVANHVADLGRRNAIYVGGVADTSTDRIRFRAASAQLAKRNVSCRYVEAGGFSYEAGYKTGRLLADELADELADNPTTSHPDRPDAVLVAGDELALGVIDSLQGSGVAIPDDVVLTGFDGLPQAAWDGYDLTTVVQPIQVLVSEAVNMLLNTSRQPLATDTDTGPEARVVAGVLRIGRTTRQPALDNQ